MSGMLVITELLATKYTVNWQAPSNTQLLDGYNIDYSSNVIIQVSSRRKWASGSSNTTFVADGTTSIVISTCPYCDIMVNVSAVYVGGSTVPLLESIRFTTPEAGMWNGELGYLAWGCTWCTRQGVALSERALIKALNSTDCSVHVSIFLTESWLNIYCQK